DFLRSQMPGGSAFVIGEAGLTTALHEAGFIMTETSPDYVVVGETRNYSFEAITKAIRFIRDGARFIATNPDATGPSTEGVLPATGAIAALNRNGWTDRSVMTVILFGSTVPSFWLGLLLILLFA
ncbi:ABC transporter permease subunit, partial [Enterococcus faecium]|uniref:ABC transporter permease subunit n=1 Tax=Enterococcus faecium TaxID=1352 RepID=UPI003F89E49E